MRVEHDLYNILRTTGVIAPPFPFPILPGSDNPIARSFTTALQKATQKRANSQGRNETPLWGESLLGRPVFMPAKMAIGDDYEIELPSPLITISGQKTIVETPLVGQDGTVKEYINIQDYSIKIVITIINKDDTYPESKFYEFVKLWKKKEVMTLKCALTDLFLQAKDNAVITGFNTPDMQGIINAQVIEYTLKSDWYYELELS